ncbi:MULTISPECIES: metalloregulator ArsR/SmtB family transcription factor [unclassified Roseitalea]|uniref:ArsR/SmtB family transcription factor n=1 Tax=unclassified Roseitalea TaxID=2639107 RepID=UPI00273DF828|nr:MULTISPECIES: metalloregulator ArsR/SmtB family transcription factor [unclassified Roseitalea]
MTSGPCPNDDRDAVLARQLAALAHPTRLSILRWLGCRGQCCCKDLVAAMPIAQSTVSQHLKVLCEAGLVTFERRHPRSRYRVNQTALDVLAVEMERFSRACRSPASSSQGPPGSQNDRDITHV